MSNSNPHDGTQVTGEPAGPTVVSGPDGTLFYAQQEGQTQSTPSTGQSTYTYPQPGATQPNYPPSGPNQPQFQTQYPSGFPAVQGYGTSPAYGGYPAGIGPNPPPNQMQLFHPTIHVTEDEHNEIHYLLVSRYGRTVKILAIIDMFFAVIMSILGVFWYAIALVFAPFGYMGAKKYNKRYILIYLVWMVMEMIFRFISPFVLPQSGTSDTWTLLFQILVVFIMIYLVSFVYRFYAMLPCPGILEWEQRRMGNVAVAMG